MILESKARPKRFFNAKCKKDMAIAKVFFKTQSWGHGGCPFFLEFPYTTIPDMMKDKIIHKTFGLKFNRFHHVWGDVNEDSN